MSNLDLTWQRSCHTSVRSSDDDGSEVEMPANAPVDTQRLVLTAYLERCSLRGLERIFGISRQTISPWFKQPVVALPTLRSTLDTLARTTFWNWMKREALSRTKRCNAGCGPRSNE